MAQFVVIAMSKELPLLMSLVSMRLQVCVYFKLKYFLINVFLTQKVDTGFGYRTFIALSLLPNLHVRAFPLKVICINLILTCRVILTFSHLL